METVIVTRHAGAVAWLATRGIAGEVRPHISEEDIDSMAAGSLLIGVFPLVLAVRAHQRGVRPVLVQLPLLPPEARGRELTAADMEGHGAQLLELCLELSACDGRGVWEPSRTGVPAASWGDMQQFRIGLVPRVGMDDLLPPSPWRQMDAAWLPEDTLNRRTP